MMLCKVITLAEHCLVLEPEHRSEPEGAQEASGRVTHFGLSLFQEPSQP